jgi:hypothetical protein
MISLASSRPLEAASFILEVAYINQRRDQRSGHGRKTCCPSDPPAK